MKCAKNNKNEHGLILIDSPQTEYCRNESGWVPVRGPSELFLTVPPYLPTYLPTYLPQTHQRGERVSSAETHTPTSKISPPTTFRSFQTLLSLHIYTTASENMSLPLLPPLSLMSILISQSVNFNRICAFADNMHTYMLYILIRTRTCGIYM